MTYFLAEGATGAFFDDDVLIANPNDRDAPVTLTFLKEGGSTVIAQRVVPAMARVTVPVDQIPGLEATAVSVKVVSEGPVPLVVERTMFWDASYYGGHTANAVPQPETRWIFAEGFQGFFDTYILIANAEATPTTATLTFLREGDTPFVTTIAGRSVRAPDGVCGRLSGVAGTGVRDRRRGRAARHRRARDVLREPAGAAVAGGARQHRSRHAVALVVPRRRCHRRLLQHVHPAQQPAGHRRERRAALPARHRRGDHTPEDDRGAAAADGESRRRRRPAPGERRGVHRRRVRRPDRVGAVDVLARRGCGVRRGAQQHGRVEPGHAMGSRGRPPRAARTRSTPTSCWPTRRRRRRRSRSPTSSRPTPQSCGATRCPRPAGSTWT